MTPRRNLWSRRRVCASCGLAEDVRKDNAAIICRHCSARASGAKGLVTIRARKKPPRPPRAPRRVDRVCKGCGVGFTVPLSTVAGRSNASGNFCSRPCYSTWLRRTPGSRSSRRGVGWKSLRDEVIAEAPFCAVCGTSRRLQVHHIVPWRISRDNSKANLIPLCVGDHRMIETLTVEVESWCAPGAVPEAIRGIAAVLRSRQVATARVLRGIAHGQAALPYPSEGSR